MSVLIDYLNAAPEAAEAGSRTLPRRPRLLLRAALSLLAMAALAGADSARGAAAGPDGDPFSVPPRQWATDAARNEIAVIQYHAPLLRYREHVNNSKGDEVRDVIESRDGSVARILYRDNHVVTPEEDAAERSRLEEMLNSPGAFAKHIKNDQSGKKLAADLLGQFPVAMTYTYTAGQPQRTNHHPGDAAEIVLDFTPDPKWTPPTLASQALTGLRGRMWIDVHTHRIMRMEGDIFQQVNFGWGFFAHVYPGGKLMLEQVSINDQRWIFSRFTESVVVRAVLIKTFRETSDIQAFNFAIVPSLSYQDAVKILLAEPLPKS